MNIAIIGTGSWGLALAKTLSENGNNVKMWSYSEEETKSLNENRKSKFLPDIIFPEKLKASTNMESVINGSELIFHVTPSAFFRETVKKYKEYVNTGDNIDLNQKIIICSKGFEKNTLMTLEEVLEEEIKDVKYGVLTGPSHAEEVSKKIQTALVIASKNEEILDDILKIFDSNLIRIYKSNDVLGAALGGALKNVLALSAGIITGLEMGDNTFAAVVTRGLVELSRLSEKMGADSKTIYGLTGLGDLLVTTMSGHSRNKRAGILIGQGKTIEEVKEHLGGMVVEGIENVSVSYELSKKYEVETPIIECVYNIVYKGNDVKEEAKKLMNRDHKFE